MNNSPQGEYFVLGANVTRGHHILFNLEQWRIGFAEQSRCEREENGYMELNRSSNPDQTINNNTPAIIYKEIDMEMVETTFTKNNGLDSTELPSGNVMTAQDVLHGYYFSMFTMLFLVAKKACNGMIFVYDNYAGGSTWDLYVLRPKKRECATDTNYNEV